MGQNDPGGRAPRACCACTRWRDRCLRLVALHGCTHQAPYVADRRSKGRRELPEKVDTWRSAIPDRLVAHFFMITDCHIHIQPVEMFKPAALEVMTKARGRYDVVLDNCRTPKAKRPRAFVMTS